MTSLRKLKLPTSSFFIFGVLACSAQDDAGLAAGDGMSSEGTDDGWDTGDDALDEGGGDEGGDAGRGDESDTGRDDADDGANDREDADGDGVPDAMDNCVDTPNSDQADLDDDTEGDVCDPDVDGDMVPNDEDNCVFTPNADQQDANSDGEGDLCENDIDGDGVLDAVDNCVYVPNADQSNLDGDAEGDACDDDIDGDGILNTDDNCVHDVNSDQANFDGDAEGDVCDDDIDGDGALGVEDCDDYDPAVSPLNSEIKLDGIDNDCDPATSDDLAPGDPYAETVATVDLTLRLIPDTSGEPAGQATLGCKTGRDGVFDPYNCNSWELFPVTLSNSFLLMQEEMSQLEWKTLATANPKVLNPLPSQNAGRPAGAAGACDDCPVENITWQQAAMMANFLSRQAGLDECYSCGGQYDYDCTTVLDPLACDGYRFPTEWEWEWAARGGEDYEFSGSNLPSDVGWWSNNSGGQSHPGCALQPNGYGLCDMTGNVDEMTSTFYEVYPLSSPNWPLNGVDPLGPGTGTNVVHRGGHFLYGSYGLSVFARSGETTCVNDGTCKNSGQGVRFARTLVP